MFREIKEIAWTVVGIILLIVSIPLVMLGAALDAGDNYVKTIIRNFKEEFNRVKH